MLHLRAATSPGLYNMRDIAKVHMEDKEHTEGILVLRSLLPVKARG